MLMSRPCGAVVLGWLMLMLCNPVALAATWTVTKADDTDDFVCDADCSLREALSKAAQGDTVVFATSFTILLDSTLSVYSGPIIDARPHTVVLDGGGDVGIIYISGPQPTFRGLTFQNGKSSSGGAIDNRGFGPPAIIEDCRFLHNECNGGDGCAIRHAGNAMVIRRSHFENNGLSSTSSTLGGAIHASTELTVTDSSFVSNRAGQASAVYGTQVATVRIANSTFSHNDRPADSPFAGSVVTTLGTTTIVNCTFASNQGSGINAPGSLFTIHNSIFHENEKDCGSIFVASSKNNVMNNMPCLFTGGISTGATALGPLTTIGGTALRPLLPGSVGIDGGDTTACNGTLVGGLDQRGRSRTAYGPCDIGAYEAGAYALSSGKGSAQATLVGTAFPQPLGGQLSSSTGDPVGPGAVVVLSAPESGASLEGGPTVIALSDDGGGFSAVVSANGIAGSYGVSASAKGAVGTLDFALSNTLGLGQSCSVADACESGHCIDGVCCDSPCGGGVSDDCLACSSSKGASLSGTCSDLRVGTAYAGVAPGSACDGSGDTDLCTDGTVQCPNTFARCVDAAPNRVEVCNGADEDCDGLTDEDFPDLGVACDGPDDDQCAYGTIVCTASETATECSVESAVGVESCNAVDDDCDDQTDEDFPALGAACDGPDEDQCANGVGVCAPGGAGVVCGAETVAGVESCNAVDDDCDGQTDEDFPSLGAACDGPDDDLCANGVGVCAPGGVGIVCGAETVAGVESCNGLDDDCDGQTDEDFPALGAACDGPDDDLCANGVGVCAPGGVGIVCGAETVAGVESCNGVDDDCDGQTDEDFPDLGAPCDGPDDDQCANGVGVCAPDGAGVVCGAETVAGVESCNAVDDDCDGQTDEDFPSLGAACDGPDDDLCANGVGVCAPGGVGIVCGAETVAGVESCNGLDDDCDGQTDEDFPALGAACDGPDDDLCANGVGVCAPGGVGIVCGAETVAGVESCNGVDDDCDGQTDEDFPDLGAACDGPDEDQCANGVGVCAPGGAGVVCGAETVAGVESCNAVDDDCDGQTDEDFPALGAPCDGPDDDQCANGVGVCAPGGAGVVCGAETVAGVESCNAVDDDCDGQTDEDFPALGAPCDGPDDDQCTNGVGVCAPGGVGVVCGAETVAGVESCNAVDDDCDGLTDEDFPALGTACDGPDDDLCANGVGVCAAGGAGVVCGAETTLGIEACNAVDDDCDGQTDEDFAGLGDPCDGPDEDGCELGEVVCSDDGSTTSCAPETDEHGESCNGVDDDCDGVTDEDFPALGATCDGPDADTCAHGLVICTVDGLGTACGVESVGPKVEACNLLDDDCDGVTDEDIPGLGATCGVGVGACASEGVLVCSVDGQTRCQATPGEPTPESCNELDDDCDGETDEDFDLGTTCTVGVGGCEATGTVSCAGDGAVVCDGLPGQPMEEVCNGNDDDCDGVTDGMTSPDGVVMLPCAPEEDVHASPPDGADNADGGDVAPGASVMPASADGCRSGTVGSAGGWLWCGALLLGLGRRARLRREAT